MPDKPLIVVTGATGAQGGGVVRAALEDPRHPFRVRAITRKPDSQKGRALAAQGVEVMAGDLDDEASLARAFAGAHGVYGVTNFWEHLSAERETAQGRNLARAAKTAGVEHFVWSTLEDTRRFYPLDDTRMPTLGGKYKVPHFDAKADADAAFLEAGVPTTFFLASFYWENFVYFGSGPKRGPEGVLALTLPIDDKKMPGIAAGDIGRCAYGLFGDRSFVGQRVGVAGEQLTGSQYAQKMSRALGETVKYNPVPPDVYRGFGFPGADELGNMFQFYAEYEPECCEIRDVSLSRRLYPGLLDFDAWLTQNATKIPIE